METAKISDLTSRNTAVTEDELFEIADYQGTPGDYLPRKVKKSIILGYKSYHDAPTQTGTNAPVPNEFKNDFAGTPVWSYIGPGRYDLTITGAFTAAKTVVIVTPILDYTISASRNDNDSVRVYIDDLSSVGQNGILAGDILIEIRVYY